MRAFWGLFRSIWASTTDNDQSSKKSYRDSWLLSYDYLWINEFTVHRFMNHDWNSILILPQIHTLQPTSTNNICSGFKSLTSILLFPHQPCLLWCCLLWAFLGCHQTRSMQSCKLKGSSVIVRDGASACDENIVGFWWLLLQQGHFSKFGDCIWFGSQNWW